MANAIGSLIVDLILKSAQFNSELAKSSAAVAKNSSAMKRSLETVNQSINAIGVGFGALVSARVIKQFVRINDEAIKLAATMDGPLADAAKRYVDQSKHFTETFQLGVAQGFFAALAGGLDNTKAGLDAAASSGRAFGAIMGNVLAGLVGLLERFNSRMDTIGPKLDSLARLGLDPTFGLFSGGAETGGSSSYAKTTPGKPAADPNADVQAMLARADAAAKAAAANKQLATDTSAADAATQAMRDTLQRQADLWADIRTPMEEYEFQLEKIRAAHATGELYTRSHAAAVESLASSYISAAGQITQTLAGAFAKNKAFAIANAVMNVAEGITSALKLPFPLNWAQVAAVTAAGIAQIQTIQSAQPGTSKTPKASKSSATSAASSSGGGGGGRGTSQAVTINLMGQGGFSRDQVRQLAEQLNGLVADGATISVN